MRRCAATVSASGALTIFEQGMDPSYKPMLVAEVLKGIEVEFRPA
jgi:hypothetical protein